MILDATIVFIVFKSEILVEAIFSKTLGDNSFPSKLEEKLFISSLTGFNFSLKEKLLSEKMLMCAGTTPCKPLVLLLYCLQKSIILIPKTPKEEPTGGAGFADSAFKFNLIFDIIFFFINK
jgi:hypothetical protein